MSSSTSSNPSERPPWVEWCVRTLRLGGLLAVTMTFLGWLLVGAGSPLATDLHAEYGANSPAVMAWVLLSLPASLLHRAVAAGATTQLPYFACVFLQWFVIGTVVGAVLATGAGLRKLAQAPDPKA